LSDKFDITKHKRYKELSDYNEKNAFDIQKYLAHKLILKKDAPFEMYECSISEEEIAAIAAEDESEEEE
jgi:type IV secretion system protein VirD4